jgi:hypothetical protein
LQLESGLEVHLLCRLGIHNMAPAPDGPMLGGDGTLLTLHVCTSCRAWRLDEDRSLITSESALLDMLQADEAQRDRPAWLTSGSQSDARRTLDRDAENVALTEPDPARSESVSD